MRILPKRRPQASQRTVQRIIKRHKKLFPAGEWPVTVLADRGYYMDSMGAPGRNDRGVYDDAIFVTDKDGYFASFNANTDPSSYRSGRATLEAPQVVIYKPGYHGYNSRYGHPAFRQSSSVVVVRDGGKGNGKALGGGRFSDEGRSKFWINNHRGGRSTTSSAGCQTIPPDQWDAYYSTVKMLLNRHKVGSFAYLLVEDGRM